MPLCCHGKVVASDPPVNLVMTECPCELPHMDTIGPSRVHSTGGKWYVLVIVDDFFAILLSLALRLFKEREDALRLFVATTALSSRIPPLMLYAKTIEHQFSSPLVPQ